MKALFLEQKSQLPKIASIPPLSPGPDSVQIRVRACALNFADLLTIDGKYQDMPELPTVLGMEFSGQVEAVGRDVDPTLKGQRVAVYSGSGGLAEFATVPADRAIVIPDGMPYEDAAAFQIAYGTSHLALTDRARLQKGETLLVTGAGGGVGLTAVEVGAQLGAHVIAAARGADKLAAAEKLGASELIDLTVENLRDRVLALGGADVVYEAVGGKTFNAAMRATNPGGRILAIGFASGQVPEIKANHLLVKNIDVLGFYWGGYLKFDAPALRRSLETLLDWYKADRLRPHIGATFPLDQVQDGLDLLRSGKAVGKIVITP